MKKTGHAEVERVCERCGEGFWVDGGQLRLCGRCVEENDAQYERGRRERFFGGENSGLVIRGELSHRQVAERLGITRTAVQKIERRALMKIRQRLKWSEDGREVMGWRRQLEEMVAGRARLKALGVSAEELAEVDEGIERCREGWKGEGMS